MLVLSRKLGERIMIGDNIVLTVVDIDRGKIRLGIEAPRDVPIMRSELIAAMKREDEPPKCSNCKCDTTNGDLCIDCAELAAEIMF